MSPKVSICVPVYNVEHYIGECIDSLISQTYSNLEIIIVNDCTQDNAMSIANAYAKIDNRIKVIDHKENKGLMRTRETAFKFAAGDYITFCDSDDKLPEDSIELLVNAALSSDADIVSGEMQRFNLTHFFSQTQYSLPFGSDAEAVYKALLLKKINHTLCGKLFKSQLIKDYKYLISDNLSNAEDGILFYQILIHAHKIIHIPNVVYYYRYNNNSLSVQRLKSNGVDGILCCQKIRQETCMNYKSLQQLTWQYISSVINDLFANGYDKEFNLNERIEAYGLSEYVNIFQMIHHLPFGQFIKLIIRRVLKLNYIRYCIKMK